MIAVASKKETGSTSGYPFRTANTRVVVLPGGCQSISMGVALPPLAVRQVPKPSEFLLSVFAGSGSLLAGGERIGVR